MTEPMDDPRRKRMKIRAWRRGMKEMDLMLGPYADDKLPGMSAAELDAFERFLAVDDQVLFPMMTGAVAAPEEIAPMVAAVRAFHKA